MSAALLRKVVGRWEPFEPGPALVSAARTFELLSLAGTYSEQQEALEKHLEKQGVDVYVAKFAVMNARDGSAGVHSWCVWSEGVPSLLPQTDVVIMRRSDENEKAVILPWDTVQRLCGAYMRPTGDEPPRFDVDAFPTAEWSQLASAGERV